VRHQIQVFSKMMGNAGPENTPETNRADTTETDSTYTKKTDSSAAPSDQGASDYFKFGVAAAESAGINMYAPLYNIKTKDIKANTSEYDESFGFFLIAAAYGCTKAEVAVGNAYYLGCGIDVNQERAVRYYIRAAQAMFLLFNG
jgi:TPR repeat protein